MASRRSHSRARTTRSVGSRTPRLWHEIGAPVAATDPDSGETLTYRLEGTDAAAFSIAPTSGQLRAQGALDHEAQSSYSVTVAVEDSQGARATIEVTIAVTDENEPAPMRLFGHQTFAEYDGVGGERLHSDELPGRLRSGRFAHRCAEHGARAASGSGPRCGRFRIRARFTNGPNRRSPAAPRRSRVWRRNDRLRHGYARCGRGVLTPYTGLSLVERRRRRSPGRTTRRCSRRGWRTSGAPWPGRW